jgi:hypothetical protein
MTLEDEEILEIPVTVHLETVNIFHFACRSVWKSSVVSHFKWWKITTIYQKIGKMSRPNKDEVRG